MATLYLMRHGQTEFNLKKLVQGHCDAPLTPLGIEQARRAAAWYREHDVQPARLASSPLGTRAADPRHRDRGEPRL